MEAIYHFETYLQWAMPGYVIGLVEDDGSSSDYSDGDDDKKADREMGATGGAVEPAEELEPVNIAENNEIRYKVARHSPYPNTTATEIINDYSCVDFLYYLEGYIRKNGIKVKDIPSVSSHFPIYKQAVLTLPVFLRAGSEPHQDVVCVTSTSCGPNGGYIAEVPTFTSTILVHAGSDRSKDIGVLNSKSLTNNSSEQNTHRVTRSLCWLCSSHILTSTFLYQGHHSLGFHLLVYTHQGSYK
jgi:hypothetical protein